MRTLLDGYQCALRNIQMSMRLGSFLLTWAWARQQKEAVVRNVGGKFLEYVPHFAPFIKCGANQLFGMYEFEHEKRTNIRYEVPCISWLGSVFANIYDSFSFVSLLQRSNYNCSITIIYT
jgi:hypothetical protein